MAAANTDKFKKVAPNTGWQIGGGGVADASVTTIPLVSSTSLPTGTGVILTIDRVDSGGTKTPTKMERVTGVVSGSNIVTCVRGVGGTAQAHSAGAVVEIVIDSVLWNDVLDGILAEHNQDGTHIDSLPLTTPKIATSINDTNGNEVIKTPATASAVNEITVTNAATGGVPTISATGDDTNIDLYLVGKGTGKVLIGTPYYSVGTVSNFNTTSGSSVDVTSFSVSVTLKKTSHVKVSLYSRLQNNTASRPILVAVLRGATSIFADYHGLANTGTALSFSDVYFDESVPAGTYTYKVQIAALTGGDSVYMMSSSKMFIEIITA